MSTALVQLTGDDQESKALAVAQNTKYLPRVQLTQTSSDLVKNDKVAKGGYHALTFSKNKMVDMGKSFTAVVLAAKPKAIRFADSVVTSFDPDSELFKQIEAEADADSQGPSKYGTEYLLYLPEHQTFATYFFNTPSMRREVPAVHERLRMAATFTSNLVENKKKQSWFVPVIEDLSVPPELPEISEIQEQVDKFRAEKGTDLQAVAQPVAAEGTRER